MTTPAPEPTADDYRQAAEHFGTDQADDAPTPDDAEPDGLNREAATLRRRLRGAEGERDALSATVERLQRREIERLAAPGLAVAGDLLTYGGVELADLIDASGDIDGTAVSDAVERLVIARPGLARGGDRKRVTSSALGGGNRQAPPAGPNWSDVLKRQ